MFVIGTAGHVDHGKSTLVQALTGINPDRLQEEQRREMTIDLGFAHLTLPSGRLVSIVDVPGHERFIKNMLAGIGGIDAALLAVAADEGVMPQTVEHLHILDLLGVEHGLVVLTKRDLVDDDWLALVIEDVRSRLAGTTLAEAEVVAVSARAEQGLGELQAALDRLLDRTPTRTLAQGVPRLPVDRVFTIGGFGTVVTGTLSDGPLQTGQEIELQPSGLRGRVRGLQSHGVKQALALPGTRVAVNISGIAVEQLHRGDVLSLPGHLQPTMLLDLKLRLIQELPAPLEQNDALDLFVGAAEVPCRVTLLDAAQLLPGSEGWVQVRLARPLAVTRGERCILRIPSPSLTVGGGWIIDAHPPRHRRFRPEVLATLETLSQGTPAELLLQAIGNQPLEWRDAAKRSGLPEHDARQTFVELRTTGRVIALPDTATPDGGTAIVSAEGWRQIGATVEQLLSSYHRRLPLRSGMPREELKSRLQIQSARLFEAILQQAEEQGWLAVDATTVRLPQWRPALTAQQRQQVERLLDMFRTTPFTPPSRSDWEALEPELLSYLIDTGQLVRVSPDVLFDTATYDKLVEWTIHTLDTAGEITVAALRDRFNTSRKYALAFLEHLDERKITRRVGDVRIKY